MEKLKEIIRNNRMSTRPEYYSGRGATTSDLNGQILEGMFRDIEKTYGKPAAKNFVKMVADIKVLSATTFLQELYELFANEWKYKKKSPNNQAPGVHVPKNENGEYDQRSLDIGVFGMMESLFSGSKIDQTEIIRGSFINSHGDKRRKKGQRIIYFSDGFDRYIEYR